MVDVAVLRKILFEGLSLLDGLLPVLGPALRPCGPKVWV